MSCDMKDRISLSPLDLQKLATFENTASAISPTGVTFVAYLVEGLRDSARQRVLTSSWRH